MEQAFGLPEKLLPSGGSQTGDWKPVEDAISTQVAIEADAAAAGDIYLEHSREKTGTPVSTIQQWTITAGAAQELAIETGRLLGFVRVRTVLSAGNVAAYYNKMVAGY